MTFIVNNWGWLLTLIVTHATSFIFYSRYIKAKAYDEADRDADLLYNGPFMRLFASANYGGWITVSGKTKSGVEVHFKDDNLLELAKKIQTAVDDGLVTYDSIDHVLPTYADSFYNRNRPNVKISLPTPL